LALKIDLHVHTCYSKDCATTLDEVVLHAKNKGLDGVAITDHDTVEGALELVKNRANLIVIPGIEVSAKQGHILGLNVTVPIPRQLDVKETIEQIHRAGGIAIAAHPSAVFKNGIMCIGFDRKVSSYGFDAVEVVNSSCFPFWLNGLSRRFAVRMSLPQTAGSDSHLPETIGLAYTLIENIEADKHAQDVIQAIKKGMIMPYGKPTPWRLRLRKLAEKGKKVDCSDDSSSRAGTNPNPC